MTAAELRALAEKATPGKWTIRRDEPETFNPRALIRNLLCVEKSGPVAEVCAPAGRYWPERCDANAVYLMAAQPSAVLALLDRIAWLESALRPFVDASADLSDLEDASTVSIVGEVTIIESMTVGQFRAARAAMEDK